MKAGILFLLLVITIGTLVAAAAAAVMTESDYCRQKLGCSNWKRDWRRCHKWCMGSNHHHKREEYEDILERLLYEIDLT